MAVGNRIEVKSACTTNISATVTIAKHLTALNDNVNDSAVFKKDVVGTYNAAATGVANAIFTSNDQVNVTTTADVTITVSGLVDGQIGKLTVTKNSTDIVSFSGVDTVTSGISYGMTYMEYLIISLNGKVTAYQVNDESRSFNLSGTPDTNVVITSQYNFIEGRTAYINMLLDCTGASTSSELTVGTLPFGTEITSPGGWSQYISINPQNVAQTEAAYCRVTKTTRAINIRLGNDNIYYIGGAIAI